MKKTLISAIALATLATTSAFAQTQPTRARHAVRPQTNAGYMAYGQYTTNDPYVVISNDRVVGRDPDANIRAQMMRDPIPDEY